MIPFNRPPCTGDEEQYIKQALKNNKLSGDGPFGKKCQEWFETSLPARKTLLTPSCTAALELAAVLIDIQPGDEVIMPSYTFVSTANAFVLRGARIVFVDIRPDTMNINESLIEAAITPKTRAIVAVHYAGVGCEMDAIMDIAERHNLHVIEDAAQGMMATYKGRALGTFGPVSAYSFHETKNFTSGGEGGLIIINDEQYVQRAEIIREKGTNRSQFFRGMVDKYSWVDMGSSYLPSELQAAYIWGQLEWADKITQNRLSIWESYYAALNGLAQRERIEVPTIPAYCQHNGHMFYIKVKDIAERTALLEHLKADGIYAVFHYIPLHSSPAGARFSRFHGEDEYTTRESERLIRLPMWFGIEKETVNYIVNSVKRFFS